MANIQIEEEDIFNFVFFPDTLTKAKYAFIESNRSRFASDIEFCKKLQKDLGIPFPEAVKKKILGRIIDPNRKIYRLFPVTINSIPAVRFNTLAAASDIQPAQFLTYKDASDKVLIRLVIDGKKQELFLFGQEFQPGEKVRCTFFPGQEIHEFHIQIQAIPLKFPDKIEEILIESIV